MTEVDRGNSGVNVQRRSQPVAGGGHVPEACSSLVVGQGRPGPPQSNKKGPLEGTLRPTNRVKNQDVSLRAAGVGAGTT